MSVSVESECAFTFGVLPRVSLSLDAPEDFMWGVVRAELVSLEVHVFQSPHLSA